MSDSFGVGGAESGAFNPPWLDDMKEIDPYAMRVYYRLVRRARGTSGVCYESVPNMAESIGMSERQAHRALKTLHENNLIGKETRYRKPTVYWILVRLGNGTMFDPRHSLDNSDNLDCHTDSPTILDCLPVNPEAVWTDSQAEKVDTNKYVNDASHLFEEEGALIIETKQTPKKRTPYEDVQWLLVFAARAQGATKPNISRPEVLKHLRDGDPIKMLLAEPYDRELVAKMWETARKTYTNFSWNTVHAKRYALIEIIQGRVPATTNGGRRGVESVEDRIKRLGFGPDEPKLQEIEFGIDGPIIPHQL